VAVNFGASTTNVTISFSVSDLSGWVEGGKTYIVSDLYNNKTYPVTFSVGGSASLNLTLPAYGTSVCILADSAKQLVIPTGVGNGRSESTPKKLQLYQNYPNPFNPSTMIQFDLPKQGQVKIQIYNVLGKIVAEVTNSMYSAGTHQVAWNGRTDAGMLAGSGVYFVRLEAGVLTSTKKIMLIK
jgi:hypothetical protein